MNQLAYLCAQGNNIGTIINEDGTIVGESVETGTSISSLANKKSLYQVNLKNNSNLANVSCFKNDTALKYLYLSGCSTTMNVNVISDRIMACGSNYSLPVKFLTGTVYKVSDYYTPANATYDELYSDLYGNTTITHLNLEGCTKLTNVQINTILKSMKQLKYLTLKDNTSLTSIDFISKDGVTGLCELDLRNTNVKGENSLVNLNENAKKLRTLRVSDGTGFAKIVDTLNRLTADLYYCYWYGHNGGEMCGLVCTNIGTLKCLEDLTGLKNLQIAQWVNKIGSSSIILDLRKTSLTKATIRGIVGNIYLPNTVTEAFIGEGGVAIIAENSVNLNRFTLMDPMGVMDLQKESFDSLRNATNLSNLMLTRLKYMHITTLSEWIKNDLPSVEKLTLATSDNTTNSESILQDLNGIEKFTGIKTLSVKGNDKILNIESIKNCTTLTKVDITNCNVSSISGLKNLTNLQTLNLNNNNISNLRPLENLKNLTELNLQNNAISDTATYTDTDGSVKTVNNINILANLNKNKNGKLERLYLSGNDNIVNWSPLSSLTWTEKTGW